MSKITLNHYNADIFKAVQVVDGNLHFNKAGFFTYIKRKGVKAYSFVFELNKNLREVYTYVLFYALREEAFMQKHNIGEAQGLLLMGPRERGKTAVMHLMKGMFQRRMQYQIEDSSKLVKLFSISGTAVIDRLVDPGFKALCLDNIGLEKQACFNGEKRELIYEIVKYFHEHRFQYTYPRLHITTSLTPKELEMRYGSAFRQMLKELCVPLVLN